MTEKDEIKKVAVNYFKNLFTCDNITSRLGLLPNLLSPLDQRSLDSLNRHVTNQEIHDAVLSIGSLKALGPDGFPTAFYQKC